jgi:hypothetical protein
MALSVRILSVPTCAHRVAIFGEPPRRVIPSDLLAIIEKHHRESREASMIISYACRHGTDACEHLCEVEYEYVREQKTMPLSELILLHRTTLSDPSSYRRRHETVWD